jgi:hypothetical protein
MVSYNTTLRKDTSFATRARPWSALDTQATLAYGLRTDGAVRNGARLFVTHLSRRMFYGLNREGIR